MSRILPAGLIGLLVGLFLSGFDLGQKQPLRYNHRKHVADLALPCSTCHTGVETSASAAFPGSDICLSCHGEQQGKSPEEKKVRDLTAGGKEIPWRKLTVLRPDVFFSHRRHVSFAKIECEACHGAMAARTSPPRHALKNLKMTDCIACHKARGASVDCNACHR